MGFRQEKQDLIERLEGRLKNPKQQTQTTLPHQIPEPYEMLE